MLTGRSAAQLLRKVTVPEGESGPWTVSRFEVSEADARFSQMRAIAGAFQGRAPRPVTAGTYTSLRRGRCLVMSDTPAEMNDHRGPVYAAKGRVLIAGLGLGVVLQAVLDKEGVEAATVIEKSSDVIDLVGPHYRDRYGDRLELIQADVLTWKPPRGSKWDVAWFDIWDTICGDHVAEITKLKRRFARRCKWRGAWAEYEMRRQR